MHSPSWSPIPGLFLIVSLSPAFPAEGLLGAMAGLGGLRACCAQTPAPASPSWVPGAGGAPRAHGTGGHRGHLSLGAE